MIWLPLFYDVWYHGPSGRPTWSPDNEQLAFCYFEYDLPQYMQTLLEISQRDGAWLQCQLQGIGFGGAAWSPVGDEIAVTHFDRIQILAPDDCHQIRDITRGSDPRWSHDGKRIVFSDGAIRTASAAGGDVRLVVMNGIQPDWSPDGMSIVFVRDGNLWTVSVDGTEERQITQSGYDEWPAWSRDGSYIAFTRRDPDRQQLVGVWLVGANGGPATLVTPFVQGEQRARPCWSQDGKQLAYFVLNGTEYRIGIGILRDWIPQAVQTRTWSEIKKTYRNATR